MTDMVFEKESERLRVRELMLAGDGRTANVLLEDGDRPDRVGDFVAKPMLDCGGVDILNELYGHLNFDRAVFKDAIRIPCCIPYITSMFMPCMPTDRPLPAPKNSINLAFVSQFVEIHDDVVFIVEYSARAAQSAVCQLMKIDRQLSPVTSHDRSLAVLVGRIEKAFA